MNIDQNPEPLGCELESILCGAAEKARVDVAPSVSPPILRSISKGEKVTIRACNGTRTIAHSGDVFEWHIDPGFKELNKAGAKTPPAETEVYEMVRNATFTEIFGSLSANLDRLVLTQDQVVAFVKEYRYLLRDERIATFFLLKDGDQFFVAEVHDLGEAGLGVHLLAFEYDGVCLADRRMRVVVPQLKQL
ncbi:MAG: hypothetical protein A3B25_01715 [Candidatus Ryanbacteria bacterium RIFCSPLOWO2_01_FULL_48_26]|uniref:Uncharacterized protein n=1 Tax=Candidatus Ryanbacteria bacterium RIFCSPLOWO2_01_FULL_48_26 TaxID=1802126 RepID=A0A1G2GW07_9BACT|nr:MAG: hypothetical protein A3B25_01715 [Candidatus Ryanbacteria bacterium RIFCSPLOWO2_01_FULL_48_26]